MSEEQLKALKEAVEVLEFVSDRGTIMISGLDAMRYQNNADYIKEIIEENE